MAKIEKIILVTAKHQPTHKYFLEVAEALSKELGVELEVVEEDYVFLNTYGEKDEFGMAWAPQLFVKLGSGEIKLILSRIPMNEQLQLDAEKAKKEAMEKLKEITSS